MFRRKVQPIPKQPREIRIGRKSWKRPVKLFALFVFLVLLGTGIWVVYSANSAIRKITAESDNQSSIFSFLGDFKNASIKGQNDGRTNILLLGMGGANHPGGLLSDSMIVASINYKDERLGLINIPRDLWVPIPGNGHSKINGAYSQGETNKATFTSGGALSSKTVENILGIPIHYYISMDFEGFKKIVDTVGGVDIYVEKDLNDPYYPAANMIDYAPLKISAGLHHMDGDLALKYARSRETTSDFDRSRRQQQVMSAIKEKVLTLDILANPKKITDLLNILGSHIHTNMSIDEMYALWNASKNIDKANIVNKVLDTSEKGPLTSAQDSRGYYIYPRKGIDNFSDLEKLAKNLFNASQDEQTAARIEVLNGTNQSGVASSVSEYLSSYDYNVTKIGDAAYTNKTIVYDYSGGKYSKLAQDIASRLNASFDTKQTTNSRIDIEVIVGTDYLK